MSDNIIIAFLLSGVLFFLYRKGLQKAMFFAPLVMWFVFKEPDSAEVANIGNTDIDSDSLMSAPFPDSISVTN
jgi:hypothetical protein